MTTGKYQALIAASFAWIEAHPDAVNTDIPTDLLSDWLHLFEASDGQAEDTRIAIFTFGLNARIAREFRCSAEQEVKVSYEKLFEYFKRWHFRLLMAKLAPIGPLAIRSEPVGLFYFHDTQLDFELFRNYSSN